MQADAFGASALLERLYGRAIRFDMGTTCGERYLDISSVRTSLTSADFERAVGPTTRAILRVLDWDAEKYRQALARNA